VIDGAIVKEARRVESAGAMAWAWIGALGAALVLLLLGTLGRAVGKPLWHDEIFTFYVAAQPAASDVWRSLAAGVDLNPPLYHLLVHWCIGLLGSGPVAVRLPAVLGFLLASAALYAFVRQRAERPFALLAALVPSFTGVYTYAYEGRPYGLVLGLAAVALLAWQRRDTDGWRRCAPFLCGVAVAAAIYTHYYAVLVLLPLAAGELTRVGVRRRIDRAMWSAFAIGALSAGGLLPLTRGARAFASTFWSRPSAGHLAAFYGLLTEPFAAVLLAAALLLTVLALGAALTISPLRPADAATPPAARGWSLPLDETVAVLALLVVPVAGYLMAVFVTGAFHERYVLFGVLGFAALAAAWLRALSLPRWQVTAFLSVCVLAFAARQATGMLALAKGPQDPLADHRALLAQIPAGTGVVVSHALTFLPLAYYAGAPDAGRFTYLMRPPEVVRRSGVDTGGRALERLSSIVRLDVRHYESFLRGRRQFFVYGPPSWLVPQLRRDGATVELIGQGEDASLFRVSIAEPTNPGILSIPGS
jgi:hypothetical protein